MKATLVVICAFCVCIQVINAGYLIDSYYVSHPIKKSWWEASRFCKFYGNQLIDIQDEPEYRKILSVIHNVKQNDSSMVENSVWTSGVRFPDEKSYYWEDSGLPVIYADWVEGDPHMGKDEKCLFLWHGNDWKLADTKCDVKCVFICRVRSASVDRQLKI